MKITDLLNKQCIVLDASVSSKDEVLETIASLMKDANIICDSTLYLDTLKQREALSSTGVGGGIAIPHGRCAAVNKAALCALVIKDGVAFDSLDQAPVHLVFGIAANDDANNEHLEILSKLSTLLMDESLVEALKNANDVDTFLSLIDNADFKKNEVVESATTYPEVLAVTACPTGIAHTYMAAESLELKAKEMNVSIKVETNGSVGIKNELTQEEIEHCKGIIVAADKQVELARFNEKPVIITKVQDGIHKPEELINQILNEEVEVYKSDEKVETTKKSKNRLDLYKHLMNGVSHVLPFSIASGFLIAIAYIIANNGSSIPYQMIVANVSYQLGQMLTYLILPVIAGFIAMSIADMPGLMVGFGGGIIGYTGVSFQSIISSGQGYGASTSGFVGAIIAGLLAGYITKFIQWLFKKLPESFDGFKPMFIYPVLGFVFTGLIMLLINPYLGLLHYVISTGLNSMSQVVAIIVCAILGAMMSIDMGGPFNKTAYIIGVGALTYDVEGGYMLMAAVMAGGMVPPLLTSISSLLFKDKYTKEEIGVAYKNIIKGLSFMSEPAIPFAKKDPKRVITSCVIGSAIAGGLSAYYNCSIRVPHGGIFAVAIANNPLQYSASILIGAIAGAIILGIVKNKQEIEEEVSE